ncbi:hypothetical protein B484DRAFT_408892 [Ochromonadaceae sp. CCMP2298]|nr:hypothetical protein B484DRAFT_408892 [Ochromonadaceae sp. CCMP2298]
MFAPFGALAWLATLGAEVQPRVTEDSKSDLIKLLRLEVLRAKAPTALGFSATRTFPFPAPAT